MDSGYYAAMTGLVARTQALDTASANLANAQTAGYRAEREYFRSVLVGPTGEDSQLGQAINRYGLLGGDRLSMAQGPLQQTGNPFDLAIEGHGFFAIRTSGGIRYTRDGSFHRSQTGSLVTAANEPVLSSSGQADFNSAGRGGHRIARSDLGQRWRGSHDWSFRFSGGCATQSGRGESLRRSRWRQGNSIRRCNRSCRERSKAQTRTLCRGLST